MLSMLPLLLWHVAAVQVARLGVEAPPHGAAVEAPAESQEREGSRELSDALLWVWGMHALVISLSTLSLFFGLTVFAYAKLSHRAHFEPPKTPLKYTMKFTHVLESVTALRLLHSSRDMEGRRIATRIKPLGLLCN